MTTTIILTKNGELNIEKGLERMDWNTVAFERELELFAKTQPSRVQEKLRKQYNKFVQRCGLPIELVVVSEPIPKLCGPKSLAQLPRKEPLPELPKIEPAVEPQAKPEITAETPSTIEPAPETHEPEVPIPLAVQEPEPIPHEIKSNEAEPKLSERKELHGYIVMPNALQVKNLFQTIEVLIDEATFKLTPKGLTLRAMDPSRVAMLDLVIPRENCEEHLCPEQMEFCFSIERFLGKTLKNVNKSDAIRLDIQTGIVDKLNTRLFGKLTRQFSMPLLEVSDEEVPTPKINFMYSARLVLENMNMLFKDLEDHVRIVGTQDGLTFEQKGDIEDFKTTLQKGDETVLNIEAKEDAKATYSVSYLKEILKALTPLTDIVEVSYSTDMPMRISADLEHLGTISFYVAPRIESED